MREGKRVRGRGREREREKERKRESMRERQKKIVEEGKLNRTITKLIKKSNFISPFKIVFNGKHNLTAPLSRFECLMKTKSPTVSPRHSSDHTKFPN